MSKKNGPEGRAAADRPRRLAVLLLALFLLLACTRPVAAQRVAPAAAAVAGSKGEAVVAATSEVLKETGELRHLSVLHPVKSGVKSREQIKSLVMSKMNEESTPAEVHASELTLRAFGLVDAAFHLRPFLVSLLTEQIAGYYDPRTREFYLADWIEVDSQRLVMSHELTHALQDQHFNLRRFEKWPAGDGDAEMAAQALVEGDATLVMSFYMMRNPQRALGILQSMLASDVSTEQIDRAPRALRASLLFPYEQGRTWALALYGRGGWEMLTKAYTDLPQSTEQILHPDKYFAREAPVKLDLGDVSRALGPGWRRVDVDVNGEWGYYLILSQYLKDDREAKEAAAGWAGDRYALYEERRTGRMCVAHLSAWDTEEDAREFFAAYARRTQSRYKTAIPEVADATAGGDRPVTFTTKEGAVWMERRGRRVLALEGFDAARRSKLLGALGPVWEKTD